MAWGKDNGNFKHGNYSEAVRQTTDTFLAGTCYNVEEKVHKLADILRRYKHCERDNFPSQSELDWANEVINERHEWWAKLAMSEAGWGQ